MLENNQKEIILLKDLGMLYPKETSKLKRRYGLYKCFCGNEFKTQFDSIKAGLTKSCGCLYSIAKTKHKLTKHKLYFVWDNMIRRCHNYKNPVYKYYGGRGIQVCNEWKKDFISFYNWALKNGYKEKLTIDRKNNDGNYEPSNCRWVSKSTQSQNTRVIRSNNTSGYRGVSFAKSIKKWKAQTSVNSIHINIGSFDTAIDAAKAYNQYVIDNNLSHNINKLITKSNTK